MTIASIIDTINRPVPRASRSNSAAATRVTWSIRAYITRFWSAIRKAPAAKGTERNRENATTGSAARRSHQTNGTSRPMPTSSRSSVRAVGPQTQDDPGQASSKQAGTDPVEPRCASRS